MRVEEGSGGACQASSIPSRWQEMLWCSPPSTDALPLPGKAVGPWGGFLCLGVFTSTGGSCCRFPNRGTGPVIVKLQSCNRAR